MKQISIMNIQTDLDLMTISSKEELIDKIKTSNCQNCARGQFRDETQGQKIVVSRGNPDAQIWVVGKSPGVNDGEEGIPFSFGSGDLLRHTLQSIGLDPERDCFFTNTVFCASHGDSTPTDKEIVACSSYFHRLIELCVPRVFLAVGSVAFTALTEQQKSMEEISGKDYSFQSVFKGNNGNPIPVWAIYHTAAWFKPNASEDIKSKTLLTMKAFSKAVKNITSGKNMSDIAQDLGVSRARAKELNTGVTRNLRWPGQLKDIEKFVGDTNE